MLQRVKQFCGSLAVLASLVAGSAVAQDVAPKDLSSSYKAAPEWGHLPDGRVWGSTAGVQSAPDGVHVWTLDRCGNSCANSTLDPILEFDGAGKLVKHFGSG